MAYFDEMFYELYAKCYRVLSRKVGSTINVYAKMSEHLKMRKKNTNNKILKIKTTSLRCRLRN